MTWSVRDRHVVGAGAAACAVCCAPLVLPLLGLAGAAATVGTFVLAGSVFAAVVAVATLLTVVRRRPAATPHCAATPPGPVPLEIGTRPDPDRHEAPSP